MYCVFQIWEKGIDYERPFHLCVGLCPTGNGNHQYVY